MSTTCGHVFCDKCIRSAVQLQRRCPTCRKKLSLKQLHAIFLQHSPTKLSHFCRARLQGTHSHHAFFYIFITGKKKCSHLVYYVEIVMIYGQWTESLASTVNSVSIRSTVYRNGEHSVCGMSFSYWLRQQPASKKHYLK